MVPPSSPPLSAAPAPLDRIEHTFDTQEVAVAVPLVDPRPGLPDPVLPDPVLPDPVLQGIAGRARPVALAGEQQLPVLPELQGLFVGGAIRRGTSLVVAGSTTLAVQVLAGPSQAGSWCATVGVPSFGVAAAAEAGLALDRLALVPVVDPQQWATVVAALLDALDVVLVRPPRRVRAADARRLAARARERGTVLVALDGWEGADVRLSVVGQQWEGIGTGHGHLGSRHLDVVATGRGAAARPRHATLTLETSPRSEIDPTNLTKLRAGPILERFG
jgi:hypothetical protein